MFAAPVSRYLPEPLDTRILHFNCCIQSSGHSTVNSRLPDFVERFQLTAFGNRRCIQCIAARIEICRNPLLLRRRRKRNLNLPKITLP